MSRLFFPGENAPYALRRILIYVFSHFSPFSEENRMRQMIARTEYALLNANMEFYNDLKQRCAEARTKQQARFQRPGRLETLDCILNLAETQKARLNAYAQRMEIDL